jgi:hypothetical protein
MRHHHHTTLAHHLTRVATRPATALSGQRYASISGRTSHAVLHDWIKLQVTPVVVHPLKHRNAHAADSQGHKISAYP